MAGIFTIPPGDSFVAALARTLLAESADDPLRLASTLILLPTRRACRALREAFLAVSRGRPLLLPRLRPIGEADEEELELGWESTPDLPPAITPLRRQLLLGRLVQASSAVSGDPMGTEQAALLAEELARLLDQVETEGLSFDRLIDLAPEELAHHWQITLDFLKLITEHWPLILEAEGAIEPARRRNLLLDAQADLWQARPPDHPVIAAGSTGSIPATARLLAVIAGLPTGRLVLPGLDRDIDPESLDALDCTHPQYTMVRLLEGLGLVPWQVKTWPGAEASPRARLVAEAMRPAATTEAWRDLAEIGFDAESALAGLARQDCPGPREEAGAIALMLREAVGIKGRTAALVTPDRDLARRVAAELGRFGIAIDDSGGRGLALTPPGAFLLLTAEMVAEDFAPVPTLAVLKHPLARGGMSPGAFRPLVRRLELAALRGTRPGPGVAGLRRAVAETLARKKLSEDGLESWLAGCEQAAAPFAVALAGEATPAELLRHHIAFAEWLSAEADTESLVLWAGEAGEAAALFVSELLEAVADLPAMKGGSWPGLLRALMAGRVVRPAWGGHPRLAIWGPLEARLQSVDLLVLGGLNQDVWPSATAADPWMSRPMRKAFGLSPAECRIGLSAHDFAQALCAPEVVITRAKRSGGTPTVPSRWLLRLDAVRAGLGLSKSWPAMPWLGWHQALDAPAAAPPPGQPPEPCPPLAARPRALPVTAIETWRRNPYAVYAQRILDLRALDPIDANPEAADYGTLLHAAFAAFLKEIGEGPLPTDALDLLLDLGRQKIESLVGARPGIRAFWEPRFLRAATWMVEHEALRRPELRQSWTERRGKLEVFGPAGLFELSAIADRIDLFRDGKLEIIDYKTGTVPTPAEVNAGYAPQLPLEAAIAAAGGFAEIPAGAVRQLLFWRFGGGRGGIEEKPAGGTKADPTTLGQEALAGLEKLIAAFDDPATPYRARPHPAYVPAYDDYAHLARVAEWENGE